MWGRPLRGEREPQRSKQLPKSNSGAHAWERWRIDEMNEETHTNDLEFLQAEYQCRLSEQTRYKWTRLQRNLALISRRKRRSMRMTVLDMTMPVLVLGIINFACGQPRRLEFPHIMTQSKHCWLPIGCSASSAQLRRDARVRAWSSGCPDLA